MNVNEFRVRYRREPSELFSLAIYKLNDGCEKGATLDFDSAEAGLLAIDRLRETAVRVWREPSSPGRTVLLADVGAAGEFVAVPPGSKR